MAAQSFTSRVADFWAWFEANEQQLEKYLANLRNYDRGEVTGFLAAGLNRAIDDVTFETGGNHEVNLSPEGSLTLCFLTTYLVGAMPEKFRSKWLFTPWKTPAPKGFAVGMFGKTVSPGDVLARVFKDEESGFGVAFHSPAMAELGENEQYQLFYILLEATLGENICLAHISMVLMAEGPEPDMVPLPALPGAIRELAAAEGRELQENPCLSITAYSMEPEESDEPRFDVVSGFTSLPDLLDSYYGDEDGPVCDLLEENGAKAGFILYDHGEENLADALELRGEIAADLEKNVLGAPGSGREIGVLLGQAVGEWNCYIDVLLYDEEAFLAAAPAVLEKYGLDIDFSGFRQGGKGLCLTKM